MAEEQEAAERLRVQEQEAAQEAERVEAERLAEERAALERSEQEQQREAEAEAAQERARRREESKAAALAALAARPGAVRRSASGDDESPAPTRRVVRRSRRSAVETPVDPDPVAEAPLDETPVAESAAADDSADPTDEETAVLDAVGAPTEEAATEPEPEPVDSDPDDRRRAAAAAAVARRREKAEAKERARREKAGERDAATVPTAQGDDVPEPPSVPQERSFQLGRVVGVVGVVIGVLGLVASVLLAVAALLVAFGFDADAGLLGALASVCDPLTSPLRGLVSFSGENAEAKESFVAYGGGSVIYLAVGVLAPSLLRRGDAS